MQINELKTILLQVQNINTIVNSNGYLFGWEVIISEPFKKMDMNPTSEQIENCIEVLQLLYSCPVLYALNFSNIIKYCFQCQQLHLVLAFLPFLNDDDTIFVLEVSIFVFYLTNKILIVLIVILCLYISLHISLHINIYYTYLHILSFIEN